MRKAINKKNYEGLGFVEALIAIMIVGISSVVLMQIAADTMKEMMQNETIDNMTQYAVEGSTMVQDIASRQRLSGDALFPTIGGYCYIVKTDENGTYYFVKQSSDTSGEIYLQYTYSLGDAIARAEYSSAGEIYNGDESTGLFRLFCLDSSYVSTDMYAIIKVIVGQTTSDGTITSGNSVKDYTYFTVVNL